MFVLEEGEACGIEVADGISHNVIFIVQGDKKACGEWVTKQLRNEGKLEEDFIIDTDGKACCFSNIAHTTHCIWLSIPPENQHPACIFGMMAHEALHAAYKIMNCMGMPPSFDNEEFVAYCVQFLMNCCTSSIGVPCPLTQSPCIP